jgi:hypothetical protein
MPQNKALKYFMMYEKIRMTIPELIKVKSTLTWPCGIRIHIHLAHYIFFTSAPLLTVKDHP